MTLTDTATGELAAQDCATPWLVLLEITHAALPASLRLTSDGVATISNGAPYEPFPFKVTLPDDAEGRAPRAQIRIDNTSQEIVALLRGLTPPPSLIIRIVRGTDPNVVERECFRPPAAAAEMMRGLAGVMKQLVKSSVWEGQIERLRVWYDPILDLLYDDPRPRRSDLDQLDRMAAQHPSRSSFLTDLTLDPPEACGGEAGAPVKDEDWLVLSTIHSAKGQEWRAVFILNVVDGCIPSDLATGSPEEIDEERRLLYVAMTAHAMASC